jgi:hypothetical protein
MSDEDVVCRVRDVVGLGRVRAAGRQKGHYGDMYCWVITALDPTVELLRLLHPLMGARRQEQIARCLSLGEEAMTSRRRRNHGLSKYDDGCRCNVCREAKSRKNARRYAA